MHAFFNAVRNYGEHSDKILVTWDISLYLIIASLFFSLRIHCTQGFYGFPTGLGGGEGCGEGAGAGFRCVPFYVQIRMEI